MLCENYHFLAIMWEKKSRHVSQKFTIQQVLFPLAGRSSTAQQSARLYSHTMPEGHHIRLNYSLIVATVPPLGSCIITTSLL
jgi:hypothetical protein